MMSSGPNLRAIIAINFALLYGVILAGISWLSWPETAEDWRMGLISIGCGLGASALAIRSVGDIWRYILRDREVDRFNRQGRAPQSDQMADNQALRDEDMI